MTKPAGKVKWCKQCQTFVTPVDHCPDCDRDLSKYEFTPDPTEETQALVSIERMMEIAFGDFISGEEFGVFENQRIAEVVAQERVRSAVACAQEHGWPDAEAQGGGTSDE